MLLTFKRTLLVTLALLLAFTQIASSTLYAISPEQKDLYSSGIYYYDKGDVCSSETSAFTGAVTNNLKEFINSYGQAAFNIGKQYTLPYEAIIAQAALESGYGRSGLTREAFNFFGIKAGSSWNGPIYTTKTQEEVNGGNITISASFRKYANAEEGFRGYGEFITKNDRYAAALKYPTNPAKYIEELKKAGYATDSSYVSKNIAIQNAAIAYIKESSLFPPSSAVTFDKTPPSNIASANGTNNCAASAGTGSQAITSIALAEYAKSPVEYDSNVLKYTNGSRDAWCASFISWVYKESGKPFTGGWPENWQQKSVLSMQAWFKAGKNGSEYFEAGKGTPRPGDVAFYIGAQTPDGGSTRHVNIVISVEGNTMTTVGGNESDSIKKTQRDIKLGDNGLVGFGRMK